MIKKIIILLCTILLFATMAWTTIAATSAPSSLQQVLQTSVTYELPYPGILPDNFLYPLKAFRDKVVSILITDAQKQAEFDLLQADKRLAAGQSLLQEKGNNDRIISETISKGENYFGDSIQNTIQAQKTGKLVNDFLDTLTRAGIKHEQVLYTMSRHARGQLRHALEGDIVRMQGFESQVNKLKPSQ